MTAIPSVLTDFGAVTLRSISVSSMENDVYLLTSVATGAQVLIDAADDFPAIRQLLREGLQDVADDLAEPRGLELVITTHSHWDHVRALPELVRESEATTAAGAADVPQIEVPTDRALEQGEVVEVADIRLDVISLRGHTPGSVAVAFSPEDSPVQLFTGDSLFPGGVGKTNSPEDFRSLLADVRTRIFGVYGDSAVVWPGHGDPTTLGQERPHLDEWEERGW